MEAHHPVIVPETFDLVSAYLARKFLDSARTREWGFITEAGEGKDSASIVAIDNHGKKALVTLSGGAKIPLQDFLTWYRGRETLIKLTKSSRQAYLYSLAQMVWQMVA